MDKSAPDPLFVRPITPQEGTPRRLRLAAGDLAYHVLNRRVGRLPLFEKPTDYVAFEKILAEAYERIGIRIAAYCLMPNHWHLLLWPRQDRDLSEVRRWITVTHTQRWHAHHHTAGTGPVYQGRLKVQKNTLLWGEPSISSKPIINTVSR